MELSKRLYAVASFVPEVEAVADIGTDHGYIPIYLVEKGTCKRVIAMDINVGPLARAKEHIIGHGLGNYIETRQSDGLSALRINEVQALVIAGMGGALLIRILEQGKSVAEQLEELILQPQSELIKVRQYLMEQGYLIVEENMVEEDGKYYPMMRVRRGVCDPYTQVELCYGRSLLQKRHPVLLAYLHRECDIKIQVLKELEQSNGVRIQKRRQEIEEELACAQCALKYF